MVTEQWMQETVQSVVPDADVKPFDLNGGGDHWYCAVIAESFATLRSFQRQKIVLAAFKEAIATGAVHALDLKCLTPQELQEKHGGKVPAPFRPHGAGEGSHPNSW